MTKMVLYIQEGQGFIVSALLLCIALECATLGSESQADRFFETSSKST